jgi:hypothetical protein
MARRRSAGTCDYSGCGKAATVVISLLAEDRMQVSTKIRFCTVEHAYLWLRSEITIGNKGNEETERLPDGGAGL